MAGNNTQLRVVSFNLLAPCYFRLSNTRESRKQQLYRKRCNECIEFLQTSDSADIYCFQEFWFEDDYYQLFQCAFSSDFNFYSAKRMCKSEGLLILIRKQIPEQEQNIAIQVKSSRSYRLSHISTRISLILELSIFDKPFILATTHLSFPHGLLSEGIQLDEAKNLLQKLSSYKDVPVLLCGDFNSNEESPVYNHVKLNGYCSSFATVHNREPGVTHRDHHHKEVLADYILFKNISSSHYKIKVSDAALLPRGITDDQWPASFTISDHRPMWASFEIVSIQ